MNNKQDLDRLFHPDSVAVVGASRNPLAIGGQPIDFLQKQGFQGVIYPVNPNYGTLAGLTCYPDLSNLPGAPDVVVVAVSADIVEDVIRAAGARGARFAIIFSAGYAETGPEGLARQDQLAQVARDVGITIIGPNCQGFMNISHPVHVGFGAPYGLSYRKGGLALTSQSGAFGNSIVMDLDSRGIGFARYISTGNEADLTTSDCLDAYLHMPDVTALAAYVEGLRDPEHFRKVARQARKIGKPLLLWKVGASPAGARAAAAHTANLRPGSDFSPDSFRAEGVIDVFSARDMAICLKALQSAPLPKGNKVGTVTVSGGAGIAIADYCHDSGLETTMLGRATLDRIRPHLPSFASLQNPVDVTGSAANDPESLAMTLGAVAEDPAIDSLIVALAAISGKGAEIAAREIAKLRETSTKPIVVSWNGPRDQSREACALFEASAIPVYGAPCDAVRAVMALCIFAGVSTDTSPSAHTIQT